MRIFIIKLLIYIFIVTGLIFIYTTIIYFRPELVDDFYYRFTTPKSHSLILGESRAGQGIHPDIINQIVCTSENHIINHAFAVGPSSYGPNYLKEIPKKLDTSSSTGLFILSVTPWTLVKDTDDDDSTKFFEVRRKLFVGNLKSSNTNPNLEYLIHYWVNKFEPFNRLIKYLINYQGTAVLHYNGWLEVTAPMDSTSNNARIKRTLEEVKIKELALSETRIEYLNKIIKYLDNYGEVILIRMPVAKQMAEIEIYKYPEFDKIIQAIADKNNVRYFNFIHLSGQFLTIDAHHLYKKDGERFTHILCDSILTYSKPFQENKYLSEK